MDKGSKVNLFTRPRRFGKSLNLSMLKYFFEIPESDALGRHNAILKKEALSDADRISFESIRDKKAEKIDYAKSLAFLSRCLSEAYSTKVIILIDVYDVPLKMRIMLAFMTR